MTETKYVEYVTSAGDRLDSIARKLYGDSAAWAKLIEANPRVGLLSSYPAGVVFRAPILTYVNDAVSRPNLPPWKRNS